LVFNYIKETGRVLGRKAKYIGAVLTLAAIAYMPGIANAQEAPAPKKPTPIEILVNSYEKAYANSKGKGIDEQIFQIIDTAYRDPTISDKDRNNVLDDLVKKVSDSHVKKRIASVARDYAQMQKRELQARTAYQSEVMKARKVSGKDKIAILARAEKTLYEKLSEAEFFVKGTQYSEEMLTVAKRGLALAKQNPGLMLTDEFQKYITEATAAVKKSKKEHHPLSELNSYNTAIEVAIEQAEASEKPEQQANFYDEAVALLQDAEKLFPFDQYGSQRAGLQKKLEAARKKAKEETPKEKPKEKPKDDDKPKDEDKPDDKPEDPLKDKGDIKDKPVDDSNLQGFGDLLEGQKYGSLIEIGGGALTEDRSGDFQHGSIKLADALDFKFLRQYENWVNAAGNDQNLRSLSAFLDLQLSALPSLAFKMDPDIINSVKIGGFFEDTSGTEWEYLEDVTEDSNFRVTMTENVRNILKETSISAWAEIQLKDFLLRTSGFYNDKETETSVQSVTLNENLNDPDGTYADSDLSSVTDKEIQRGVTALAALRLNNGVKGHIGLSGKFLEAYKRFAGSLSSSKKTITIGLDAKILTEQDVFGAALALTQDIEANGRDRMTAAKGFAAAALNISPIEFAEGKTLDALLFGDVHANAPRGGKTMYGGGGGMLIGNTAQILPQVLDWLANKDAHRIDLKPEISDSVQEFSERRGFRNLLLTNMTEGWGAAVAAYVEAAKEIGLDGRLDTVLSASAAGILDTPPAAFVLTGHYSDGILKRTWGIDFIAHIKKHGFAVGAGYNQTNYLITRQEVRGIEGYIMIPLGRAPEKEKE